MNKSLQKIERLTDPLEFIDKHAFLFPCFADVIKQLRIFGRYTGKMFCAVSSKSTKFITCYFTYKADSLFVDILLHLGIVH